MVGGGGCSVLKRGEGRWEREKGREREDNRNNEGEREISGENKIKILLLFLEYCYSAIPKIELHYSKYCKKFIILAFSIPGCSMFWSIKC